MHNNTLEYGDLEEIKDVRLVAGEDGRHYLHVIFALPPHVRLAEAALEERLRLHLTDGVNHTFAEVNVVIDQIRAMYHKIEVENTPTMVLPAAPKKRQFKQLDAPNTVAEGK